MKHPLSTLVPLLVALAAPAHADTVLVATGDNTIRRISSGGQDLGVFTAVGLNVPSGMALDPFGNLYVSNLGDDTVRLFSPAGHDLGVFAATGLSQPLNLIFDRVGDLLVANNGDNSVRRFSPAGRDLGVAGSLLGVGCLGGLALEHTGDLLVTDPCANVIRTFSPADDGLGLFATIGLRSPVGVTVGASGDVFVSNAGDGAPYGHTIHRFSPTGEDRGTFAAGGLGFPASLAFDREGELLVADEAQRAGGIDYAIRRFSATGQDRGELVVLASQPRALVVVPPLTPFGAFTARVRIRPGHRHGDSFEARLAFTLGPGNDGIDPRDEAVNLRLGPLFLGIPAGSFQARGHGQFTFEGLVGDVRLSARIVPRDGVMQLEGHNADLDGASNPLPVLLNIGDDSGATSAVLD